MPLTACARLWSYASAEAQDQGRAQEGKVIQFLSLFNRRTLTMWVAVRVAIQKCTLVPLGRFWE